MTTSRRFPLLLLAALAAPAIAAPQSPGAPAVVPGDVRYSVRLDVGADGRVAAVDTADAVPDTLRGIVHAAASRATFAPATRDGAPVPARVWVTARVGFAPAGDKVRAQVEAITGGGGVQVHPVKETPMNTRARGWSADVYVRADFDADGRLITRSSDVERVEMRRDPGLPPLRIMEKALRSVFDEVVEDTLYGWRWVPDEIDGQRIAGTFRMPVGFPSASAVLRGEEFAPDAPAAAFTPRPPAGLAAARLQPWAPLAD